MAALRSERRVFLWHIRPHVTPPEAAEQKQATLEEVVDVLDAEHSGGRARVYLGSKGQLLEDDDPNRNDKNQLYVAQIKRDPTRKIVTLLINRGDPDAVSPALLDPEANAVRVEHPKEKEAPGWSAHLVISTEAVKGAHRACFEQMPRVSSQLVLDVLDKIVARALTNNPHYRYQVVQKSKKGKPTISWKPYRPTIGAKRVPSERLQEDLDQGELQGVTLTRTTLEYAGIGVDQIVKHAEEKIVLALRPADKSKVEGFLSSLIPKAKAENYSAITFKIAKLPGNQSSTPTLPLDEQDALEQLYVRAKRLTEFKDFLEQCYSDVHGEIEGKMCNLVHDPDNW